MNKFTELNELEQKNQLVIANAERLAKYFPNIKQLALGLQERIAIEGVVHEQADFIFET